MLSDALGRTAYMLAAFTVTPSPLEYVFTAALVLAILLLSVWVVPACLAPGSRRNRAGKTQTAATALV